MKRLVILRILILLMCITTIYLIVSTPVKYNPQLQINNTSTKVPDIKHVELPLNPADTLETIDFGIPAKHSWKLLWSDEFARDKLNEKYWTLQKGAHRWGNSELQYYTDRAANCYTEDGNLIIRALKEDYMNSSYTSARIITKDKVIFHYGKIEIKAKVPYGKGLLPAIWLLPVENIYTDSKKNGEIDIMEMLGDQPNTIYGVAHYLQKDKSRSWGKLTNKNINFTKDFHIYSIEWSPKKIEWFIDNKSYYSLNLEKNFDDEYNPFLMEFYLIISLPVGGDWPGTPTDDSIFPALMEIDYVKYYGSMD